MDWASGRCKSQCGTARLGQAWLGLARHVPAGLGMATAADGSAGGLGPLRCSRQRAALARPDKVGWGVAVKGSARLGAARADLSTEGLRAFPGGFARIQKGRGEARPVVARRGRAGLGATYNGGARQGIGSRELLWKLPATCFKFD